MNLDTVSLCPFSFKYTLLKVLLETVQPECHILAQNQIVNESQLHMAGHDSPQHAFNR